ncbi:MAG: 23S rRNA (adenine(2503)-C(2))-methyltransferase RlmN [Mariprofundaceae bacterium]|nr:23S rRNA (adenine(2503)-C(2))-methyltransferase RlmN [Mariprofundaceae bacterium]
MQNKAVKKPYLTGMNAQALLDLCRDAGVKDIHAETLNAYIFRRGITDWHAMPELPQQLHSHLDQHVSLFKAKLIADQRAEDGTRKILLAMPDGKEVESVLIPASGRLTQCVSTQVGCAIGCKFCLTATAGLTRNLSTAEIMSQVFTARHIMGQPVTNLVLMGMGEPLHNYDAVADFVRMVTDPKGMAFSPRRVTLSTAGLVPAIYRMIEDDLPCSLAVSLNATTDEIRSHIMPINQKYPIAELLSALRAYIDKHGRKRILIEYILLGGINDSIEDAKRLIQLLDGMATTINLLPFNPFPGTEWQRPERNHVEAFRTELKQAGFIAVVRESRGRDISAACGQLKTEVTSRKKLLKKPNSVVT